MVKRVAMATGRPQPASQRVDWWPWQAGRQGVGGCGTHKAAAQRERDTLLRSSNSAWPSLSLASWPFQSKSGHKDVLIWATMLASVACLQWAKSLSLQEQREGGGTPGTVCTEQSLWHFGQDFLVWALCSTHRESVAQWLWQPI